MTLFTRVLKFAWKNLKVCFLKGNICISSELWLSKFKNVITIPMIYVAVILLPFCSFSCSSVLLLLYYDPTGVTYSCLCHIMLGYMLVNIALKIVLMEDE